MLFSKASEGKDTYRMYCVNEAINKKVCLKCEQNLLKKVGYYCL